MPRTRRPDADVAAVWIYQHRIGYRECRLIVGLEPPRPGIARAKLSNVQDGIVRSMPALPDASGSSSRIGGSGRRTGFDLKRGDWRTRPDADVAAAVHVQFRSTDREGVALDGHGGDDTETSSDAYITPAGI